MQTTLTFPSRSRLACKAVLASALLALAGSAQAVITLYTAQAPFLAAVTGPGVDSFASLSITSGTPSPMSRAAGSFGYTVGAAGGFYGAGSTADVWLSTNEAASSIVFFGFGSGASAVGGNFFGSNQAGAFANGSVTLVATDTLGATLTRTITGATVDSFVGFVSNGTIVSVTLSATQPGNGFLWPTANNLTVALAVPEPESSALLLAGLGITALLIQRRRGRSVV